MGEKILCAQGAQILSAPLDTLYVKIFNMLSKNLTRVWGRVKF